MHAFTMKLWAFAVGASIGGLAGWIFASKVAFINPDNFPFFFSVIILAAVVLGAADPYGSVARLLDAGLYSAVALMVMLTTFIAPPLLRRLMVPR